MKIKIFIIPVLAAILLSFLHRGNSTFAFNPARSYKKIAVEKTVILGDDNDDDFYFGNSCISGINTDEMIQHCRLFLAEDYMNIISKSIPVLHLDLPPPAFT